VFVDAHKIKNKLEFQIGNRPSEPKRDQILYTHPHAGLPFTAISAPSPKPAACPLTCNPLVTSDDTVGYL
jgi:hypothetical protein